MGKISFHGNKISTTRQMHYRRITIERSVLPSIGQRMYGCGCGEVQRLRPPADTQSAIISMNDSKNEMYIGTEQTRACRRGHAETLGWL